MGRHGRDRCSQQTSGRKAVWAEKRPCQGLASETLGNCKRQETKSGKRRAPNHARPWSHCKDSGVSSERQTTLQVLLRGVTRPDLMLKESFTVCNTAECRQDWKQAGYLNSLRQVSHLAKDTVDGY